MELRGFSCVSLEPYEEKRKNCCVSRSFGKKVTKLEDLSEAITKHCLNAAEKIRLDKQTAKKNNHFHKNKSFSNEK